MDRTKLKNYAPKARREFIEAMTERAAFYGLTADKTEPIVEKGDVAVIGGRSFPIAVARKRKSLEDRIKRYGFQQTMEAMAYTWFNRLVAIRYMELHGYLDHGYRVLSHPDGKPTPEILDHAEHVDFQGLKKDRVIDLKLAGNQEGELYRLLLTAQCNALHTAMPFLFERIDDETELLLPANLLNSDSVVRKLVNEIDEDDWQEVEIIGWLYQFYISEKKDEVIGKVVASEDIPAATQLFTPNWIVKYLVQNTLGRQWLATYPDSPLRQQMEYYIEPAEQALEVQEQLKAITPTSLNPEELTLLDPACGSGHILVEAYDLFKAIYQERGYRAKDIPALILHKNLFGLEIDDRAAQLAAFALMMKARADDRRIFDSVAKPNILAFEDSQGMNANEIAYALNAPISKGDVPNEYLLDEIQEEKDGLFSNKGLAEKGHVSQGDIVALLELFENAKTFGSLIQVPPKLALKLPEIEKRLNEVLTHGDLTHASAHVLKPLLQQARLLDRKYGAVVANPPYMGSKGFNNLLKKLLSEGYPNAKADLYGAFIEKCIELTSLHGALAMITIHGWMFLNGFTSLREKLLDSTTFDTFLHIGYNSFPTLNSKVAQASAFALVKAVIHGFKGNYFDLNSGSQSADKDALFRSRDEGRHFIRSQNRFRQIPGSPLAFWVDEFIADAFARNRSLRTVAVPLKGMFTGDNDRFMRFHWEVTRIATDCRSHEESSKRPEKWYPYQKGGEFRRWFGNLIHVVNFQHDGAELRQFPGYGERNPAYYFKEGVAWTDVTSSPISARLVPAGVLFDSTGPTAFPIYGDDRWIVLAFLNSSIVNAFGRILNSTFHFTPGDAGNLPFPDAIDREKVSSLAQEAYRLAKADWDEHETSLEFQRPSFKADCEGFSLAEVWQKRQEKYRARIQRLREIEGTNDRLFAEALRVPTPQGDVMHNCDSMEDGIGDVFSYAIGCMMGRYSLDMPGLIYAHSGNQGFDASQYKTFRADDDGIIPLLESDWGIRDDATNRFVEFVSVAWPKEHLEENLKFVADSLGTTGSEQPQDTIRRYLATGFYKHHLSMYKKRPIYWLFSSGKQRAFQCLVYLHRYHEGTLARMRTEYVIPLQGQIAARIEQLEGDKTKATSTSHRNKIQKEQDKLKKQQVELSVFEEKLKHYADMRISLDLDDGVKVNYAKFGDLLAESKAITGGKDDE
jgi:hypothetical protein